MSSRPTILVATWRSGLFAVGDGAVRQEIPDGLVCGLARDRNRHALAIVGGTSVSRRGEGGDWRPISTSSTTLACCVALGEHIFLGTNDARVLRCEPDGSAAPLEAFDQVAGRESWYAGAALIDGQMVGPPLGVRSLCATCDDGVLLANVHVGGIPRSSDAGASWSPTIDINCDAHQVCAHPTRPELLAAATGVGLAISRDAGETWSIEREGLHALHCTAVAFLGEQLFISAATDHFAKQGAVYQCAIDRSGPLRPVSGGLPRWLDGISDTGNIAAYEEGLAVADRGGNLYFSADRGASWERIAQGLPPPSAVLIL